MGKEMESDGVGKVERERKRGPIVRKEMRDNIEERREKDMR